MLAFRFDGFQPAFDYNQMSGLFTGKWQHRRSDISNRIVEDPTDTTTNQGYLFSEAGELPGSTTADTTAILHQEAEQAAGAFDAWWFDTYHEETLVDDANDNTCDPGGQPNAVQVGKLNRGLKAYLADATITSPKFAINILGDNLGLRWPNCRPFHYLNALCDFIDTAMADSRYLKTKSGKPILGLYPGSGSMVGLTEWNQCLGRLTHGAPYTVVTNGGTALAGTLGVDSVVWYGPNNMPTGPGQVAFSAQIAKDQTRWSGGESVTINLMNDVRAQELGGTTWVDQATQPQLAEQLSLTNNVAFPGVIALYAWNELAEGGPGIAHNAQEGGRYSDALKWFRNPSLKPATYIYELALQSLFIANTGTWTLSHPDPTGIAGAHDSDEIFSSTTNDAKTLTHQQMSVCELMASKGPDRGIVEAKVDGAHIADVDLYAASPVTKASVWSSGTLSVAPSHSCGFVVTGTKNGSSSSVKVQIDSARVTYRP